LQIHLLFLIRSNKWATPYPEVSQELNTLEVFLDGSCSDIDIETIMFPASFAGQWKAQREWSSEERNSSEPTN